MTCQQRAAAIGAALLLGLVPGAPSAATFDVITHLRANPVKGVQAKPVGSYGETRTAIMAGVPSRIDVPVKVPANARLRLGLALRDNYLGQDMVPIALPTRFSASLVLPDGRVEPLVERVVDLKDVPADRRWIDLQRDLSPLAGSEATLRLEATVRDDPKKPGTTFALWSHPVLYDAVEQETAPNLLFITIDALRADHLGCYGYRRPTSPRLDRLAADGVRFENAFTSAPMTVPSLPQIFTSAYFPRSASPNLLSSLLAGGVLRTKAIIHNPYLEYWLKLQARESFDSVTSADWHGDHITRAALRWLEERRGARFALYLHYLDTHTPYKVPEPAATVFTDRRYQGSIGARFGDVEGARAGNYDERDRAQVVDLYDGAIRFVDEQVGLILDRLARDGLLERTLVVVSADHGEELWDHGSFFHGHSLYDELLRVPLLVRFPGRMHAGRVVREQVRAIDIVPTIAEALGLPTFPGFQGASLVGLAKGDAGEPRPLFARAANPDQPYRFALRTPKHKLILTVGPGSEELYDLVADPHETRNLIGDPAMATTLEQMRAALADFRAPLRDLGFQIRAATRDGAPQPIEVQIEAGTSRYVDSPDRIDLAPGDELQVEGGGRSLRWRGTVGATPAGIRFDRGTSQLLDADSGMTIRVHSDGRPLPPSAIRLGAGEEHPPAAEFTYKSVGTSFFGEASETPVLQASAPPALAPDPGEPLTVFVWRAPEPGPAAGIAKPADDDARRRLRALGYVQ